MRKAPILSQINLIYGCLSGLIGGITFSLVLVKKDIIGLIGKVIRLNNPAWGMAMHLTLSILYGALFSILFYKAATKPLRGLLWGIVFGILGWFAGPMTLIPALLLGDPVGSHWNYAYFSTALPILMGHMIYGATMGLCYGWLTSHRVDKHPPRSDHHDHHHHH